MGGGPAWLEDGRGGSFGDGKDANGDIFVIPPVICNVFHIFHNYEP
jgi:hypothetical protein